LLKYIKLNKTISYFFQRPILDNEPQLGAKGDFQRPKSAAIHAISPPTPRGGPRKSVKKQEDPYSPHGINHGIQHPDLDIPMGPTLDLPVPMNFDDSRTIEREPETINDDSTNNNNLMMDGNDSTTSNTTTTTSTTTTTTMINPVLKTPTSPKHPYCDCETQGKVLNLILYSVVSIGCLLFIIMVLLAVLVGLSC
jgi:hypothetical protein